MSTINTLPRYSSITEITSLQITEFLSTGLLLLKIPDDILASLHSIRRTGLAFFHLPEEDKTPYPFDQRNGYLNQALKTHANIQRYIYRDRLPAPQFAAIQADFENVEKFYTTAVFQPLAEKIFDVLNIKQHLESFIANPDQTLSLIYYPAMPNHQERLTAHKDSVALTALWAPEAGLEVKLADGWQAIGAEPNHLALNLGQALELATGKQCNPIEHRVSLQSKQERFSLASFFGPNRNLVFTDYSTGEIINPQYGNYVDAEIAAVYNKM